jgi:glycosyltransferase involved in cell wall biosynthesis
MDKIYIQIASYRDPELLPTIVDCIENAKYPKRLVFGIAWQHNPDDKWDTLHKFKDDPRFKIIDIHYKEAKGVCHARNLLNRQWSGEKYTLQLDSHHRFTKNWDVEAINMIKSLVKEGYKKPLLTAYIPSYDPANDPASRHQEPWELTFDRFIPEGAVFMLPQTMRGWQQRILPMRGRYLSAHFIFTLGKFCKEVPYDPNYYFHGEEISLAVRAYTHGYDIFYPHKVIAWHEYTRKGRTKQWDDDPQWGERNRIAHLRNRKLFGMDGETQDIDFGEYGFGTVRTLEDYERYAGISFSRRAIQQYTMDNQEPPNPIYLTNEEYEASFMKIFKHCIDVAYSAVPLDDYDFWVVAFEDDQGNTIHRQDAVPDEISRMKNDPDGYCKIWRTFNTAVKPVKWVVWPHSVSQGWCNRLEGNI